MTTFPGIAAQIAEVIGVELTERLLRRRGGQSIDIPVYPARSLLAEIIGVEATHRLKEAIGVGRVTLPCGEMRGVRARRKAAKEMLRDGKTVTQVATVCDMCVRTVHRYRQQMEEEDVALHGSRQLGLPF